MTDEVTAPVAYPFRRLRLAGLLLMGVVLTLVAALVVLAAGAFAHNDWFARIAGVAGVLFFGACSAFAASRLFSRAPGLVLDHEGIIDRTSFSSVGRIPWSEVVDVRAIRPPTSVGRSLLVIRPPKFLVLDVRNPQMFIDRGGLLHRLLLRSSNSTLGSPVAITPSSVHANADELAAIIRRVIQRP
jgi:hypothetical protein